MIKNGCSQEHKGMAMQGIIVARREDFTTWKLFSNLLPSSHDILRYRDHAHIPKSKICNLHIVPRNPPFGHADPDKNSPTPKLLTV